MKYCIIKNIDDLIIKDTQQKSYNAGFIAGLGVSLGIALIIHGWKMIKEEHEIEKQANREFWRIRNKAIGLIKSFGFFLFSREIHVV